MLPLAQSLGAPYSVGSLSKTPLKTIQDEKPHKDIYETKYENNKIN